MGCTKRPFILVLINIIHVLHFLLCKDIGLKSQMDFPPVETATLISDFARLCIATTQQRKSSSTSEKINIGIPTLHSETGVRLRTSKFDQQSDNTSMNMQVEWPQLGVSDRQKFAHEAWQFNDEESSIWERASTLSNRLVDFTSELSGSDSD